MKGARRHRPYICICGMSECRLWFRIDLGADPSSNTSRKKATEKPDWAALPKHLVSLLMQRLVEASLRNGLPDPAICWPLQLVCKSWREAFLDFSTDIAAASFQQRHSTDLFGVCKMLPSISRLRLSVGVQMHSLYLSPLSACSYLTRLSLSNFGNRFGAPQIDILALPPQLRHLEIENVKVDPACYPYMKSTQLTCLTFNPPQSLEECKTFKLLEQLPKLEVRPSTCV